MVDNFLRLGIVDSDLVTKVMQCVDRKLFLDAKNLKLAYNDRRIVHEKCRQRHGVASSCTWCSM